MDEEQFNMSVRKFLKTLGVTAQREIEKAVRDALDSGRLQGDETLKAHATVKVEGIELKIDTEGDIKLS
ncbi:conserved hypothetical protein [Nitrosococcus halophilus Nc 4]|uniref:Uncharacterized protein n=1 Tax=Nitrosococcus halophilus (strain Nc4) TaxID=472759 RepID=D5C3R8_NITHN|nr:DUF6494 family protein [Nitrosococcus halophilus]ADE15040.1 conserved hypothetical protein [Nitrosococcus halophilus Nc 4]